MLHETLPWFILLFLVVVVVQRIGELVLSRMHERRLIQQGGERKRDDGFWLIALAQTVWLVGLAYEGHQGTTELGLLTWVYLPMWVLANALRYWCIATLGDRWTVRLLRLPQVPLVERGPYRWLRHPNYAAVIVEVLAGALMFHALATALIAGALHMAALWNRVQKEDAFLGRMPRGETSAT